MTVRTRTRRRGLGLVAAVALAAAVVLPGGSASAASARTAAPARPAAPAVSYVPLTGDGSSWAEPAIDQFARDVRSRGIVVNFSPDGSAAGREQYAIDQNDFAATDTAYLTTADPFGAGAESVNEAYSYIPIVAGGTTFMYNLVVGHTKITNLRLSGDTITKIFTGQITNWDNPQITHDYGRQLPSQKITVVTRSDGSGASYELSEWMDTVYRTQWVSFCKAHGGAGACGPTEFYPGFANSVQRPGSDQVADYLASSAYEGSIGYDEYSYAKTDDIPVVSLLNSAGYYTQPTASNVAISLQAAQINEDPTSVDYLIQNLDHVYTNPDPRTYELSSYSYLIVPRKSRVIDKNTVGPPAKFTTAKGDTLASYLDYVLCGAQQKAADLGYSPLPVNLVQGGVLQEEQIPQTGAVAPIDIKNLNNCDNPTYHNGVNYLVKDAAFPSPCAKDTAPLTCTTGGTGSSGGSNTGGSGGGGGSTTTSGSTGSTGSGSTGSATGAKDTGVSTVNPVTGQVESGATDTGDSEATAAAVPTGGPHGSTGVYATLVALALLAAVLVPAGLGMGLRRRGGRP